MLLTQLASDSTNTTRQEPAHAADISGVVHLVPVFCKHAFLDKMRVAGIVEYGRND